MSMFGIAAIGGGQQYRISSIHGNPYRLGQVQRVERQQEEHAKPLVIASPVEKDDFYVKDYGELKKTQNTATGDFAELLATQERALTQTPEKTSPDYMSRLNDTIGMMGFQNCLRDRLNGSGFMPFA